MVRSIPYTAAPGVAKAIAAMSRTEDCRFSPNNRRLAVAAFSRNSIFVFDLAIGSAAGTTEIALTGGLAFTSTALQLPHGLDFLDDDTIIVTSRNSDVAIFRLPPGEETVPTHALLPIARWPANEMTCLETPGSVTITRGHDNSAEVLICNNDGNTITRHRLDGTTDLALRKSEILLHRYLNVPDGVTVSPDCRWIAVSNHSTHNVLLFENSPDPTPDAAPVGILRYVNYPHGLRFTADGKHLIVADAGAPFLQLYARDAAGWTGVRHPVAAVKIMEDEVFKKGQRNREEGGAKGIDLDRDSSVLVVTSDCQPLAFFDLPSILRDVSAGDAANPRSMAIDHELILMEEIRRLTAERLAEVNALRQTVSWRITAPLRRLKAIARRSR